MTRKEYNHSVDQLSDALYHFALRYTANRQQSADAVQDTFTSLWTHRDQVQPDRAKAWLYQVLYHKLVDMHRKLSREQLHAETEPTIEPHQDFELRHSLQQALQALPEVQRSLVLLRDLEGYTYQEMAQMLNLTPQQVMVYLYRARQTMKKFLTHDLEMT